MMKVWQLASLVRERPELLSTVAAQRPEWLPFRQTFANLDVLFRRNDRSELDAELPDEYVVQVLSLLPRSCFLGTDGWLRSRRHSPEDQELPFLDAYVRYGGTVLEDVCEYGSVQVVPAPH